MKRCFEILGMMCLAAGTLAETSQEVFNQNTNILSGGISQVVSNTVFCVARIHANIRSLAHAAQNEILTDVLVSHCLRGWAPETNLARSVQGELLEDYIRLQGGFREVLPSLRIVYEEPTDRRDADCDYVRVWGIEWEALTNEAPTWANVKELVTMPESFPYPDLNPLAVLQIAPEKNRAALLDEFIRRLRLAHGTICADVIAGKRPQGFSIAEYIKINRRSLHNLTFPQLYDILGTVPYHPAVLAELADRYQKAGLSIIAQHLAKRGRQMAFIDAISATACGKLISGHAVTNDTSTAEFDAFPDAFPLLRPLYMKATFRGSGLTVLGLWGRPFPGGTIELPDDENFKLGAMIAEKRDDLFAAYVAYRKSVEQALSFEGCKRAGELAREVGRPYEAIVLLSQALSIDPNQQDLWKELAAISESVDEKSFANYCHTKSTRRLFK